MKKKRISIVSIPMQNNNDSYNLLNDQYNQNDNQECKIIEKTVQDYLGLKPFQKQSKDNTLKKPIIINDDNSQQLKHLLSKKIQLISDTSLPNDAKKDKFFVQKINQNQSVLNQESCISSINSLDNCIKYSKQNDYFNLAISNQIDYSQNNQLEVRNDKNEQNTSNFLRGQRKISRKQIIKSNTSNSPLKSTPKIIQKKIVKKQPAIKQTSQPELIQTRSKSNQQSKDKAPKVQAQEIIKAQGENEEQMDKNVEFPLGCTYNFIQQCQQQLISENLLAKLKNYNSVQDTGQLGQDKILTISQHVLGVTQVEQEMQIYLKVDFAQRQNGIQPKSIWLTKKQAIENCKDHLFEYMLKVCIWPPPSKIIN